MGAEDAAILNRARQQYSDALTIAPLINASGDISPAAFNRAFRTGRAGMMRAARGKGGEMGDLATVAQYMREPGTSLTAERAAVLGTLAGTGWIEPHSAATAAATANVYNRLGPRVLREKAGVKKGPAGGANPPEAPPPGAAAAGEPVDLTPIDPAGGPAMPPGGEPPLLGGPGGAAPDPRVVELQALRDGAKSEAVRSALDERLKAIDTETRSKQDAAEFRAAAEQVTDPATKQQLLAKADELDPPVEPIPAGEATEITPEVIEPGAIREDTQSTPAASGKADEAPVEQARPDSPATPAADRAQADEGRPGAGEGEVDGGRLRADDLQPEGRQEGVQADGGAGAQAGKAAGEEGQTHLNVVASLDEDFTREQQRVQEAARPAPMSDRGLAAVRKTLEDGAADGSLDKDGVALALWALERNPNLAKGLKQEGLKVEVRAKTRPGRARRVQRLSRVDPLIKGNDRPADGGARDPAPRRADDAAEDAGRHPPGVAPRRPGRDPQRVAAQPGARRRAEAGAARDGGRRRLGVRRHEAVLQVEGAHARRLPPGQPDRMVGRERVGGPARPVQWPRVVARGGRELAVRTGRAPEGHGRPALRRADPEGAGRDPEPGEDDR